MAFLIYLENPDKMLLKGAILMKTEYDISTKEISCLKLVDDILFSKLGLKPANGGAIYLRELIKYIYIYKKIVMTILLKKS